MFVVATTEFRRDFLTKVERQERERERESVMMSLTQKYLTFFAAS